MCLISYFTHRGRRIAIYETLSNEGRQISRFIRPEIQDVHSVFVGGYSNAKFGQNH